MEDEASVWIVPVEGMTCGKCVARVEAALAEVEGLGSSEVSLEDARAVITVPSARADDAALRARVMEAIEGSGYDAGALVDSPLAGTRQVAKPPAAPHEDADAPAGAPAPRSDEAPPVGGGEAVRMAVRGMTCASCVARVERALSQVEGAQAVAVNYAMETASLRVPRADEATLRAVREAVEAAGYSVEGATAEGASSPDPGAPRRSPRADAADARAARRAEEIALWRRRWLAGVALTLPIMALQMGPMWLHGELLPRAQAGALGLLAYLTALLMVYVGRSFFINAWRAARHGSATMDTLVAMGAGVAFVYSSARVVMLIAGLIAGPIDPHGPMIEVYFESAAMIITLIALGKWLEARAKGQAGAAIEALMALGARSAQVRRGDAWVEVATEALIVGDVVLVRPGERLPADGIVRAGRADIDESMITGEAAPVTREVGDEVLGATINTDGRLEITLTRVGDETALSQIAAEVSRAQEGKADLQRLADRISSIFVPAVIVIAALTFIAWGLLTQDWMSGFLPMIAVLVVACPCALGLATPTALMVGSGRGASEGVLIREVNALERARKLDAIIFDKTGTLTRGELAVTDVRISEQEAPDDATLNALLSAAAALESGGAHPIAAAIIAHAESRGVTAREVAQVRTVAGEGVEGELEGALWRVGKPGWVWQGALPEAVVALEAEGKTVVGVSCDGAVRGWIAARDQLKPEAAEVIATLTQRGVEVWMVTGDARGPAERVADALGLPRERVMAGVRPQDKALKVQSLREGGRVVAMVGDGINDAPALAAADLGVAMGSGAEVALHAADITVMSGSLRAVSRALGLARATHRTIVRGLFWAFIYNTVLIPVAALGWLTPAMAAGAMALSSVSVVMSALWLRRAQIDA